MAKRKGPESWNIPSETEINQLYGTKDEIFDSATKISKSQYETDQQKRQMYLFITILTALIITIIGISLVVNLINANNKFNSTNNKIKRSKEEIKLNLEEDMYKENNNYLPNQMNGITGNQPVPQQPMPGQIVQPLPNQYQQPVEGQIAVPQDSNVQNPNVVSPDMPQEQNIPNNIPSQASQIPNQGGY